MIPCWVLLSEGFARRGQREVAAFVPGSPSADPRSLPNVDDIFKLFRTVFGLSGRRQYLDIGHFLEIGPGQATTGLSGVAFSDS